MKFNILLTGKYFNMTMLEDVPVLIVPETGQEG